MLPNQLLYAQVILPANKTRCDIDDLPRAGRHGPPGWRLLGDDMRERPARKIVVRKVLRLVVRPVLDDRSFEVQIRGIRRRV